MLTIKLQGGLCNQLFQLATAEYVSKKTGRILYINSLDSPETVHSNEKYYETILKNWKQFYTSELTPTSIVQELPFFIEQDLPTIVNHMTDNCMLDGYFQKYKYVDEVRDDFIKRLSFNTQIADKYPDISKKTFIHIRGGDYVNHWLLDVHLEDYYKRCIENSKGEEFVVFTNDKPFAKQLIGIDCEFICESDVNTLYLMSLCKSCICANSSFSWWGAYLNPNRTIFMPSKWFNDPRMNTNGFYFPGVNVVDFNS